MSVNYWRTVRYTDDGCTIYQCLSCYNDWEARTKPGWYDSHESFPYPVKDGGTSYYQTRNGVKIEHWTRKRKVPIYKPVFHFCPFCGTKWDGPIRCNNDNEHMYGPRRLKIYLAERRYERDLKYDDEYYRKREPRWWWVLEQKSVWEDGRGELEEWKAKRKYKPKKYSAVKMYQELLDAREESKQDLEDPWPVLTKSRIVIRRSDDYSLKYVYESF